jgi:hypothetical protein
LRAQIIGLRALGVNISVERKRAYMLRHLIAATIDYFNLVQHNRERCRNSLLLQISLSRNSKCYHLTQATWNWKWVWKAWAMADKQNFWPTSQCTLIENVFNSGVMSTCHLPNMISRSETNNIPCSMRWYKEIRLLSSAYYLKNNSLVWITARSL